MKKIWIYIISNAITFIMAVLQFFLPICISIKITILLVILVLLSVQVLVYAKINKPGRKVGHDERIETSRKFILQAKKELVIFGGDLSWSKDYDREIKELTKKGVCEIQIVVDQSDNTEIDKRKKQLTELGCKIIPLKCKYGLRCMISDPFDDERKAITYKKINNNLPSERSRNKYMIIHEDDRYCKLLSILVQTLRERE